MEFGRFPFFIGVWRTSEMEIVIFEIVSKTFVEKLFSRNGAFPQNAGEWAERVAQLSIYRSNSYSPAM